MAGNSSTYELRQQINQNNIERWENWSMSINYVVDLFNDVVKNLTDRLDLAESTIEALTIKIELMQGATINEYVQLQYSNIEINSASNIAYTKSCGVFSNVNGNKPNDVYIYSDKSLNGFYVNGVLVANKKDASNNYIPFANISGSDSGTIVIIKTDNATKIGKALNLYFSLNPSLGSLTDSSITANMKVKIDYSAVVQKNLVTFDKSALSKAIIETLPVLNEKLTVDKKSLTIGQYSTTKTAAVIAKNAVKTSTASSSTITPRFRR